MHNFTTRPLKQFILEGEDPRNYNVRDLLLSGAGVWYIDFKNQEDRYSAWYTKEPLDIQIFLEGGDVAQKTADLLGVSRDLAKTVRHGTRYGMGFDTLRDTLNLPAKEVRRIGFLFEERYAETVIYAKRLQQEESFVSPIYKRRIKFNPLKPYTNFNWLIQGSCADLLLSCLDYILDQKEVKLLAHFHDGMYLDCGCSRHQEGENCHKIEKLVKALKNNLDFFWPGTEERVFKFEVKYKGGRDD